jgi:CubicO group peptidase (beta-lactamase class C family)
MKITKLILLIAVVLSACGPVVTPTPTATPIPPTSTSNDIYWPTESWRTSTPEEQGMDSQKLTEMLAVIQERDMNIHGFLVIRNGYIVSETYFKSYKQDTKHDMQSVGRSFTSTLVGIAIDKGYIDGVDHRIIDFFPERTIANLDQQKQDMTLEDVLTMRSGLEGLEGDPYYQAMQESDDWVQFLLDRPVTSPPGTKWEYCSGCSHLLTAIIHETTDTNPRDFAEQTLFKPLGILDVAWMTDPAGVPYGAGGFRLTPRDMAKLGYLYLQDGQWDGQQIVSSEWVKIATQRHADVDVDTHFGYGYHWFTVTSMEGYAAIGNGGQIVLVIPKSDLLIVTTAATQESIFELIEQYVLPAVQDSQ